MTDKIRLRCSSLPIAFLCGGSVRPSSLPINDTNAAATLGTAAHDGLAVLARTGGVDWDGVPALARKHEVDETELRVLLAQGQKLWNSELPDSALRVRDCFPDAQTEVEGEHEGPGYVLTGHADVVSAVGDTARIADWKGGRLDGAHREQLLGYAALALFGTDDLNRAEAGILWVRDCDYEPHQLERAGLAAWEERLVKEVVEWDGTYRPGPHCDHCDRMHECPARNARARADLAIVADRNLVGYAEDAETLASWTAEDKIDLVEKARVASKLIDRVLDALKADVIMNGGEISDGKRRLVIINEDKRSLDPIAAIPVLQEAGFGTADLAKVMSMSAAKAEAIAAERAPKRGGAKAVRELQAKLKDAGAIRVNTVQKLTQRRA